MANEQNPNMSRLFQSAGSAQTKQGTGYTNLGRLMSASKDNLLGQKVAGTIGSQVGGVQQQLADQQKAFGEESEKNKIGGQKDIDQREAVLGRFTSPSGAGGEATDEDVSAFERFRSGQYAGPQGLKDTSALKGTAQQLQGQVSNFSPSGTQELLRRSVGGDRYTQGQQRLDTLLMDKSKLTPIARQAQGLGQQISRADLAASGQAELQKNLAKQFGQETQEKLTAGMGGIETDVQKRLAEANLAEGTRQAKIQAVQQFQQDASKRGGGNTYGQLDYLKNLLSSQGADTGEIGKLFGGTSATTAESQRQKSLSEIDQIAKNRAAASRIGSVATSPYGKINFTDPSLQSKYETVSYDDMGTRILGTDLGRLSSDVYSGKLSPDVLKGINAGINYRDPETGMEASGNFSGSLFDLGNQEYKGQLPFLQPQTSAANESFYGSLGQAGQSLRTGSQEQFYKDLATRLANSQGAQNLTEQGLASTQQRASYEALNKLLGRTPSESKYKTVQQQIDPYTGKPIEDTSFYKAGQYKLT